MSKRYSPVNLHGIDPERLMAESADGEYYSAADYNATVAEHDALVAQLNAAHMVTINRQAERIEALEAALRQISEVGHRYVEGSWFAAVADQALGSQSDRDSKS